VSLGNDVVDLADPETRDLHPRFDERVFAPRERALLSACSSPHVLRWALWAAKESAYKALRRLDPHLVFSPKRFAVELPGSFPEGRGRVIGQVAHGEQVLDVEVCVEGELLHAVSRDSRSAQASVLARVDRADSDPSAAVRRLAAAALGPALGLDPAGIRIVGRPPVARHRGRRLAAHVSLSHHGRFVAFAGAVTMPAARPDLALDTQASHAVLPPGSC